MLDDVLKNVKPKMDDTIANLENELSKIRTGRANPAILDLVMVPYYGGQTPIRELATISVPESNQIVIKPWDRNALGDIEAAIRNSNLGINPINDGQQIRLILPPMTEERRKAVVQEVKKIGEEAKIALRNVRREAWDKVQKLEKNGEATEDDRRWAEEELNKMVNDKNKEVDAVILEKEKEVLTV